MILLDLAFSPIQIIIKHASVAKLLLFFGLLPLYTAFPFFDDFPHRHHQGIFRHSPPNARSTIALQDSNDTFYRSTKSSVDALLVRARDVRQETEIANERPCNEVLCNDGRCVSDSWMCKYEDIEELPTPIAEGSDQWKKHSMLLHYAMAICGVILLIVMVFTCICAIEEEEFSKIHYDVRYTPLSRSDSCCYNSDKQVNNNYKSSSHSSLLATSSSPTEDLKAVVVSEFGTCQTEERC